MNAHNKRTCFRGQAGQVEASTSRAALDTQGKGEGSKVGETTVGVMLQEPV